MPKYLRSAPIYYAILEETEDQAEMDCGCLIQDNEDNESTEYWLCSMHHSAQRMLEVLDAVATAAYVDRGADAIQCVFCEQIQEHEEDCPIRLVHEVIREAKEGEAP